MREIEDARLIVGEDGRVLEGNAAAERLFAPGPLVGAPLARLVSPGDAPGLEAARERARRGEHVSLAVDLGGRGPGALVLEAGAAGVLVRVLLVGGGALGAHEVEALAHGISHDLGAHVRSLASFVGFLREDAFALPESAREDLARIDGATARLRAGLESVVGYLRAPAAEGAPGTLREAVSEALAVVDPGARGATVKIEGGDALVPLPAEKLARMIGRLLENAIEFGGGLVTVTLGQEGPRAFVAVADAGPGLSDEARARATEVFTRLRPRAPGETHAGLGLATVGRAARAWGGELSLGRSAQGGLEARLDLPRLESAELRRAG